MLLAVRRCEHDNQPYVELGKSNILLKGIVKPLLLDNELFPRLWERRIQRAGTMSGGEQQMLAIGRALMSQPRLLLLDEPSLGLAPIIIQQIFDTIEQLRKEGMTIFLVEQNANQALKLADRGYVLENGRVVLEDTGDALLANEAVRSAYLGG
jgi:branched-chain amino acid transport system ATP-binding protein